MDPNAQTPYHEKQKDLLCGKHSLNSIMGYEIFTKQHLDEISWKIEQDESKICSDVKPNHHIPGGFYTFEVLERALNMYGLTLHRLTCFSNCKKQTKLLVQIPGHWIAFVKYNGTWYNCDSLLSEPKSVSNIKKFISNLQKNHITITVFTVQASPQLQNVQPQQKINVYTGTFEHNVIESIAQVNVFKGVFKHNQLKVVAESSPDHFDVIIQKAQVIAVNTTKQELNDLFADLNIQHK